VEDDIAVQVVATGVGDPLNFPHST
jgi:hypothetical protein